MFASFLTKAFQEICHINGWVGENALHKWKSLKWTFPKPNFTASDVIPVIREGSAKPSVELAYQTPNTSQTPTYCTIYSFSGNDCSSQSTEVLKQIAKALDRVIRLNEQPETTFKDNNSSIGFDKNVAGWRLQAQVLEGDTI